MTMENGGNGPDFDSVSTDVLSSGTADTDITHSISTLLQEGYAIGYHPQSGSLKWADATSYSTDDAAIQAVNDYITAKSPPNGIVYIPGRKSNGNRWVIENTVTLGDRTKRCRISAKGVGFAFDDEGSDGDMLRTTINNGDPLFEMVGDVGNLTTRGGFFDGFAYDGRDKDAPLLKTAWRIHFQIRDCRLTDFIGDGIIIDSRCYDWSITNTSFRPNDTQSTPTARAIVGQNTEGSEGPQAPGDGTIADSVSVVNSHATSVDILAANGQWTIAGHMEGADDSGNNDNAVIRCRDGRLAVTDGFWTNATNNGAHGIHLDDNTYANIQASRISFVDGDGIKLTGGLSAFNISPDITFESVAGDAINIASTPGQTSQVPYSSQVEGTVSYPSGPWDNLAYPDGWKLAQTGTLTLSGGAGTGEANAQTTKLFSAGVQQSQLTAEISVQDPSFDADYRFTTNTYEEREWDDSNQIMNLVVQSWWEKDPGGGNDVTLDIVTFERQFDQ